VADRNSPQKHVWRARIILATADGCGTAAVMRRAGVAKPSVWRWQARFMAAGVDGLLHDKTRPARIPPLPKAVVEAVVTRTLEAAPADEASHWTAPAMAQASGLSVSSVQRIWRAHGLRPHQVRRFKLSTDPRFAEKVEDIVGLYVDPPAHAVVLSVDEKSQIQALDRTQPGLPMKQGRCGTMTHDYKRNGTTTLFAALNVLDGSVIGRCMPHDRCGVICEAWKCRSADFIYRAVEEILQLAVEAGEASAGGERFGSQFLDQRCADEALGAGGAQLGRGDELTNLVNSTSGALDRNDG
jgi:hypothetical protein